MHLFKSAICIENFKELKVVHNNNHQFLLPIGSTDMPKSILKMINLLPPKYCTGKINSIRTTETAK